MLIEVNKELTGEYTVDLQKVELCEIQLCPGPYVYHDVHHAEVYFVTNTHMHSPVWRCAFGILFKNPGLIGDGLDRGFFRILISRGGQTLKP